MMHLMHYPHPSKSQRGSYHPYFGHVASRPTFTLGAANLSYTEDAANLSILAPGFRKEDLKIELDGDFLVVTGTPAEKEATDRRHEFNLGSFERRFRLSDAINRDDITARYENGILHLRLGKKPQAPKTEISVA